MRLSMIGLIAFTFFVALSPLPAHAGDVVSGFFGKKAEPPSGQVLTFQVFLQPGYKEVLPELDGALLILNHIAPKGVSLEATSKDVHDFVLEVSDPMSPDFDLMPHRAFEGVLQMQPKDAQSYSIVMEHAPNGPYVVRIFWDRIVNEVRGGRRVERADAFSRLVVALGREIYGSVLTLKRNQTLLADPKHRYSDAVVKDDQKFFEEAIVRAGLDVAVKLEALTRKDPALAQLRNEAKQTAAREKLRVLAWEMAQSVKVETPLSAVPGAIRSMSSVRCERLFRSEQTNSTKGE